MCITLFTVLDFERLLPFYKPLQVHKETMFSLYVAIYITCDEITTEVRGS